MAQTKTLEFERFRKLLLKWGALHQRDLPWRRTRDPYAIWVSEVMLQQTQVERVKEYYARFLREFPTVSVLARAQWPEVLDVWRGLGYYRRARSMQKAAQILMSDYSGKIPPDFMELQKLPGIGEYTAGAICSFAFGQDVPALDTNAQQVFGHVFGRRWRDMKPSGQREFARECMGHGKARAFNYALMDFGTWLRSLEGQIHKDCPFGEFCEGPVAFARGRQKRAVKGEGGGKGVGALRPLDSVRLARGTQSTRGAQTVRIIQKVAVGVLIRDGKVLISRRRPGDTFAGYWEFPGGKAESGEDERACLKREMMEELGIEVSVRPAFYRTSWYKGEKKYVISFHRCSLLLGEPDALEVAEFKWVLPENLQKYRFPPVNKEVFGVMLAKKAMWRV